MGWFERVEGQVSTLICVFRRIALHYNCFRVILVKDLHMRCIFYPKEIMDVYGPSMLPFIPMKEVILLEIFAHDKVQIL